MLPTAHFSLNRPNHVLQCTFCGTEYPADPFRLSCDVQHPPALLRAVYSAVTLDIKADRPGMFRYQDWLPVDRCFPVESKPITYTSQKLASWLGLDHLFISFNGYWPERAAQLLTGSFKELEAPSVLARIPENHDRTLVLASAGNTGRAFAQVCSTLQLPLCLVIPEQNLSALWSPQGFGPSVKLIAVGGNGDYSDAIALGQLISQIAGFFPEGGAANVARRDGMGLTVVDAAATLGRIPDHYFQAVGSGTGGIAAWEANMRLLADGRFGSTRMKLHLAQNLPFTPIVDAWKTQQRTLAALDEQVAKQQIAEVAAEVLTNRKPAYTLAGGLYEALVETQGEMYAVTNQESAQARALFEDLEGIDISAAAGVATAALMQAVAAGKVKRQDWILLNITSGGIRRLQQERSIQRLQPDLVFLPEEIRPEIVAKRLQAHPKFSN